MKSVGLIGLGFLLMMLAVGTAQDATLAKQKREDDSKLIEGLRRRRLFDLAESYCRQELAQTGIDPTTEATLTIELMKTLTARAILSPSGDRASAWSAVDQVADDFSRKNPNHPRLFLIRVQHGLSHMAHSDLLQQEIAADMALESDREKAFLEIRTSRSMLGALQRDIVETIPQQRGRTLDDDELTVEQLLNLNNNIRYQLVVCNLNRAKLYGATDRLNRVDALNMVQGKLIEVQREASEGQPLWWNAKLVQIECFLLLGKPELAKKLIESLPVDDIDPNTRLLLLEGKIHLAIALGDVVFSQEVAKEVNEIEATSPRVDLALVEMAMDVSVRSSTDLAKQQWLNFASQKTREIEVTHGAYWGRRAGLILIEGAGKSTLDVAQPNRQNPSNPNPPRANVGTGGGTNHPKMSTELDLLIRMANQALDKKRLDDALKAYQRAEAMARQEGNSELAFRLGIHASQVLEQQDKHSLAANRLLESSLRESSLPIASAAHLRGCWNFAQTMSDKTPEQTRQFQELLAEHLRTWPSSESANQVRLWLAGQLQAQNDWQAAFDTYLKVPFDSPHFSVASVQAANCARNILGELRRQAKPTRPTTIQLIGSMAAAGSQLAESDPVAMRAFLAQVELDLVYGSNQPSLDSIRTLQAIEASEEGTLRSSARAIQIALLGPGSPEQAKQLIAEIASDGRALDLSDRCLEGVWDTAAGPDLVNAMKVRMAVIESALKNLTIQDNGTALHSPSETAWLLRKSKTLSGLDRHAESAVVLEELETRFPRNAEIKMELARALTIQFGDEFPEQPLAKWRRIAGRLKPHTANWYEAKYNVALLIFKSGKKAEAAKLLKYIQAIPPGWDNSDFKSKFEQLLKATQ